MQAASNAPSPFDVKRSCTKPPTPFAERLCRLRGQSITGGKPDDITAVVAFVEKVEPLGQFNRSTMVEMHKEARMKQHQYSKPDYYCPRKDTSKQTTSPVWLNKTSKIKPPPTTSNCMDTNINNQYTKTLVKRRSPHGMHEKSSCRTDPSCRTTNSDGTCSTTATTNYFKTMDMISEMKSEVTEGKTEIRINTSGLTCTTVNPTAGTHRIGIGTPGVPAGMTRTTSGTSRTTSDACLGNSSSDTRSRQKIITRIGKGKDSVQQQVYSKCEQSDSDAWQKPDQVILEAPNKIALGPCDSNMLGQTGNNAVLARSDDGTLGSTTMKYDGNMKLDGNMGLKQDGKMGLKQDGIMGQAVDYQKIGLNNMEDSLEDHQPTKPANVLLFGKKAGQDRVTVFRARRPRKDQLSQQQHSSYLFNKFAMGCLDEQQQSSPMVAESEDYAASQWRRKKRASVPTKPGLLSASAIAEPRQYGGPSSYAMDAIAKWMKSFVVTCGQ